MNIKPEQKAKYDEYVKTNSKDPYSLGVVTYSERWADLMEKELAASKKLEDIADLTSHKADTDGITGFMYGCAVSALSRFWVHGEELRIWHNLKTQLKFEGVAANKKPGAVLNPALLNIGE